MNTALLEGMGFTRSEIAVYEALLELGPSTTGPIVERSGASSSKIYELLEKLIQKGLVNFVLEGKVKTYEAAHPKKILDYLEEKEKTLGAQKEAFLELLPQLELKQKSSGRKQHAAVYRGYKGMETAFNEALEPMRKGDTVYVTNVFALTAEEDRFFKHWNERRAAKGVRLRMMLDESARGQLQAQLETNPKSELRFLPQELRTPAAINVYRDRVVLFLEKTSDDRIVIVIWGKAVCDSFKVQFDVQWQSVTRRR